MPQDFDQLFKDLLNEPLSRLSKFQNEQFQKLLTRLNELAREAVKEDIVRLQTEINELRNRVAVLESERAETAADSVQSSF